MERLFGTDGIRGKANRYPMDAATAVAAGAAIGAFFKRDNGRRTVIVIGKDTRQSGDMLEHALAAGICSAGAEARLLGVMPTPAVAYVTASRSAAAGVVISASHNPFDDNGIKVFDSRGFKLSDADEQAIEALILEPENCKNAVDPGAIGKIERDEEGLSDYVNFLLNSTSLRSLKNFTVVLDCANGATFEAAPELFRRLGATVIPLFREPDGTNINDRCGSQHPESLAQTVIERQADIGLAFDGDGDRLIAVDETGTVLSGDRIMAICARDLLDSNRLPNRRVVCTVMSNLGFNEAMELLGIQVVTTGVGDRHVIQAMLSEDAVLGGEDSGHIIFRDRHTTGDGLMAALHLIGAVQTAGRPLSWLAGIMTVYPQELINVDVRSKPDLATIDPVQEIIAQAQEALGKKGRVLVRYSGTQNQCRVMVEGPTPEVTHGWCIRIADEVRRTLG